MGDRFRFTTIAHSDRSVLGPLSPARVERLVAAIAPAAGARIVELGCGKATLLIGLLERSPGASAEGFDRNPWFLAEAARAATAAGVDRRLSLIETDSPGALLHDRAVDVAIAIGATGIVGGEADTIAFLASIVVPGGQVVFGDGVWVSEPPADGLETFGMARDELVDGADGLDALGRAAGLRTETVELVGIDEWDAYEDAYAGSVETWAAATPDDPDHDPFLARATAMRTSYTTWRRHSMGFAIALFRRP